MGGGACRFPTFDWLLFSAAGAGAGIVFSLGEGEPGGESATSSANCFILLNVQINCQVENAAVFYDKNDSCFRINDNCDN